MFKKLWWLWLTIVFIILAIGGPLIINAMFKQRWGINFLVVGWNASDALQYYGTLLGAIATIIAVVVTIQTSKSNQISVIKAELEKDRKEKWLLEAHDTFKHTVKMLSPTFFVESLNDLTTENTNAKMVEIDRKRTEIIELLNVYSFLFAAAPIPKSNASKFDSKCNRATLPTIEEWKKVADETRELLKNYTNNEIEIKTYQKQLETWDYNHQNYAKNSYATLQQELANLLECIRDFIHTEIHNTLTNS